MLRASMQALAARHGAGRTGPLPPGSGASSLAMCRPPAPHTRPRLVLARGQSGGGRAPEAPPASPQPPAPAAGEDAATGLPSSLPELGQLFAAEDLARELADTSALGRRGEAWLAAQVVLALAVFWPPVSLQGLVDAASAVALAGGVVVCGYGLFSLGPNLSPLPQPREKHQLVTDGAFAYCRHPLYAGLLATCFGLAGVTHDETRLVLAVLLWLVLEGKVATEEAALVERYGDAYRSYAARVKKFLPSLY